jgi:hypothetical protein
MPARWFRKRPIVVEAIRWTGDNEIEIQDWISGEGANGPGSRFFNALSPEDRANCDDPDATAQVFDKLRSTWVLVLTGQWVICGVRGELHPIEDDVLEATYELVPDADRADDDRVVHGAVPDAT